MSKYENLVFSYFLICVVCLPELTVNTVCPKSLSRRESFQVDLEDECLAFVFEGEMIKSSSIASIVLRASPENDTLRDVLADVIIEEYKEDKYIEANTWTVNCNETFQKSYFSQNAKMKITFKATGIGTKCNMSLHYEEIEFKSFVWNTSYVRKNEITPWVMFEKPYRPNSKYTFHIDKNESLSSSSILIVLNKLDADKEIGEYLLIGAGLEPFEGPPPLCITEAVDKKKYLVDDETAYIVFVTNATRGNHVGFNISWEYRGTVISKPEIDEKDDLRKSALICIYNVSAAKEEITKSDDIFKEFRENLAEIATKYLIETESGNNNVNTYAPGVEIKASSVNFLRIFEKYKNDESRIILYAMVQITDNSVKKGKAVFDYKQLERIISMYSEKAESGLIQDNFMFRKCGPRHVPESWFYFGLILIIPVLGFALLLWVWKQNPIAEHYEKKRKLKRASQHENSKYYADNCDFGTQSIDGNPYTTLPKVQITNEHGRRTTLNLSDMLLCDDNNSDDELFNKMYSNKRRSDVLELQRMKSTNQLFFTNEGEYNAAFELNEDNASTTEQRQHGEKNEHTYESVKSSTSMSENTRL